MRFTKIREVKSPERGTRHAAGIDFFVPQFSDEFVAQLIIKNPNVQQKTLTSLDSRSIILRPHERILIPSGIRTMLRKGHTLIAVNKSGVSAKKGLDVLACLIDADYTGEVHISLVNTSDSNVEILPGEKVVQLVEILYEDQSPEEVSEETFERYHLGRDGERGEGGFGSTGTY